MPIDPGGTCASLLDRYALLPATVKKVSASTCSTYEADAGFTLSHYGSHTSLPTLKPGLTAWAPRLCTDCLPGFVRAGVSPTYTAYTELAHPQRCTILRYGKSSLMIPSLFCRVNIQLTRKPCAISAETPLNFRGIDAQTHRFWRSISTAYAIIFNTSFYQLFEVQEW
jgi:hypothetical protein